MGSFDQRVHDVLGYGLMALKGKLNLRDPEFTATIILIWLRLMAWQRMGLSFDLKLT
jgi:hypothetical protein